jgi:hypothetical protein
MRDPLSAVSSELKSSQLLFLYNSLISFLSKFNKELGSLFDGDGKTKQKDEQKRADHGIS